jgi:hypothetical protein
MNRTTIKFRVSGNTHGEISSRIETELIRYIGDSGIEVAASEISVEGADFFVKEIQNDDKYIATVIAKVKDV